MCVEKITRSQLGYMSNNCAKTLIFDTGELLCLYILSKKWDFFFKDKILTIYSGRARGCVTTLLLRNSRVTSTVECELELFCCGEAG